MPIGIFDSGYGGLTILRDIQRRLPQYDYVYLGDNARAPYGTRSFDLVYEFTLQAVKALFERGCHLVILACNTASAKALRSIQQNDLPGIDPARRVLGVIRPTVEVLADITESGHIGVLATPGTVASHSYALEIGTGNPGMTVTEHACPMWVPLVENNEAGNPGADYFVAKYIDEVMEIDSEIDTLVLGCTHFPILIDKIRSHAGARVKIVAQGGIVAESLADYLLRHPEIESTCSKNGSTQYLTTENPEKFNSIASLFMEMNIESSRVIFPTAPLDAIREKMAPEAIPLLDSYIAIHPDDDEGYRIRGSKEWALGKRSAAINDYLTAIRINPDSKAKMALRASYDILNYFNKDLLNP